MAVPNPHGSGDEFDESAARGDSRPSEPGNERESAPDSSSEQPEGGPLDVDAAWERIVADLAEDDWPETADSGAPRPAHPPVAPPVPRDPTAPRPLGPRDWPTTPEVEALEEAETHFTPPEPPPVLARDPLLNMAWLLVIGVPILLIVLVLTVKPFPPVVGQVACVAFGLAIGVLVWRMPHRRDHDDDDPGAVV